MTDKSNVWWETMSTCLGSELTSHEAGTVEQTVAKIFSGWLAENKQRLDKDHSHSKQRETAVPADQEAREAAEQCHSILEALTILARGGCNKNESGAGPERTDVLDGIEGSLVDQIVGMCACDEGRALDLIDKSIAAPKG